MKRAFVGLALLLAFLAPALAEEVKVLLEVPAPGIRNVMWFPDGRHLLLKGRFYNVESHRYDERHLVYDIETKKATPTRFLKRGERLLPPPRLLCYARDENCYLAVDTQGRFTILDQAKGCQPRLFWYRSDTGIDYDETPLMEWPWWEVGERPSPSHFPSLYSLVSNSGRYYLKYVFDHYNVLENLWGPQPEASGDPYATLYRYAIAEHRPGGRDVYTFDDAHYVVGYDWLDNGGGRDLLALLVVDKTELKEFYRERISVEELPPNIYRLLVLEVVPFSQPAQHETAPQPWRSGPIILAEAPALDQSNCPDKIRLDLSQPVPSCSSKDTP